MVTCYFKQKNKLQQRSDLREADLHVTGGLQGHFWVSDSWKSLCSIPRDYRVICVQLSIFSQMSYRYRTVSCFIARMLRSR